MDIEQRVWTAGDGWRTARPWDDPAGAAALALVFAGPGVLDDGARWREIQDFYPGAALLGCSTGGEILGDEVLDDSVAVTALRFAHTTSRVAAAALALADVDGDSFRAGAALAAQLVGDAAPRLVFVLSDGTQVNGAQLSDGLRQGLGDGVLLTGGLAGDGAAFGRTLVGLNELLPAPGRVAAVALYGDGWRLGCGSFGGWDRFGPERLITRSSDNVLYEIDGEPALELYKRYLGEDAAGLPGSALLFPLLVRRDGDGAELVRTIVGVDEAAKSMIFAGDVPQGASAQLMRGHFDHLVDGAENAARLAAADGESSSGLRLAVLVSCIGRKLLLGQRIGDEVEACADVLGPETAQIGFYSYGELSPSAPGARCELHNQTMTITTIAEA